MRAKPQQQQVVCAADAASDLILATGIPTQRQCLSRVFHVWAAYFMSNAEPMCVCLVCACGARRDKVDRSPPRPCTLPATGVRRRICHACATHSMPFGGVRTKLLRSAGAGCGFPKT
mmetsp:Transcript_43423/g.98108  ORF Transcript_43423/g.98108 Transcript_43423/m.98108 type:complete len:117 (-) Transcript_43423:287-637(-)